ncbi:MAG: two pore domain potassium channel family protein [Hyphomicrobiaceae bacterium]|nr:two pore domain potassium channel family protein [Hyphomicrobiaceae bacterium]MCC0023255.1 two pore domain potassium channel family protein [Hyphomicrobiaceae bacterium]
MLATFLVTMVLVGLSVFVHYEVLRAISSRMEVMTGRPRQRLLVVVSGVLFAHVTEILIFAGAYVVLPSVGMGTIQGVFSGSFVDYFYLSASAYTTLGIGDLFPEGALRFLTAVEALVGLVLIGWSTSFTYLAMRDFWSLH